MFDHGNTHAADIDTWPPRANVVRRTKCVGKPRCWCVSALTFLVGLVVVTIVPSFLPTDAAVPAPTWSSDTVVQLFEWNWNAVAKECEDVLAAKGYRSVQVSPPTETKHGSEWWTRYQPVSYRLDGSRGGTADEFRSMIERCNTVGIRVIVDVVINHLADGSGVGTAGSLWGNRSYAGASFRQGDMHHDTGNLAANCFVEFSSLENTWNCDLGLLPDVATGKPYARRAIVRFLDSIRSCGTDVGFRVDAAKHIPPEDLTYLLEQVGNPWNYLEVGIGAADCVQASMYYEVGHVTAFNYGLSLGNVFKYPGKLDELKELLEVPEAKGDVKSERAVVFIDNHDTQAPSCFSCAALTNRDGPVYDMAVAALLASPYGTPVLMSSYYAHLVDHDAGPSYPVKCGSEWICEHRRPQIANMVLWRKTAGGSQLRNFQCDSSNRVAFGRGPAFIAFNRDSETAWYASLQTGLPQGVYCNVIADDVLASCPEIVVDLAGMANIVLPPLSMVAMHIGKFKGIIKSV